MVQPNAVAVSGNLNGTRRWAEQPDVVHVADEVDADHITQELVAGREEKIGEDSRRFRTDWQTLDAVSPVVV